MPSAATTGIPYCPKADPVVHNRCSYNFDDNNADDDKTVHSNPKSDEWNVIKIENVSQPQNPKIIVQLLDILT